jgi:mannitol/fructose-specific phosphotransferase system IIA component (Ntr-type)|uniref:PTS sugar transporter subunit IIA n=1 Tax=candidate division WOR-3 bacterium TaxID=2052148 RepID=A0A7V6CMS0_UNCW3
MGGKMLFYPLLRPERINLDLKNKKKVGVLKELVKMIKGEEDEKLVETLLKREELGSTGIGKGIAIPHCRSLLVDKLEVAVGYSKGGVDFDALDKKPVHLFFLIVAPPHDVGNQYLLTLGRVAEICQQLTKKRKLVVPDTPQEFIKMIKEIEEKIR